MSTPVAYPRGLGVARASASPPRNVRPQRRRPLAALRAGPWLAAQREEALTWPVVRGEADASMYAVVLALTAFGVVMVFSTSQAYAQVRFGHALHFVAHQAVSAALGVATMLLLERVDYHHVRAWAGPALITAAVTLVLVLAFGRHAGGATRWLALGPVRMQPAEVAKLALIVWLAVALSRSQPPRHALLVSFALAGLTLLQRDFGGAALTLGPALAMVWLRASHGRQLIMSAALLLPAAAALIWFVPYRRQRLLTWLERAPDTAPDQLAQSLQAFHDGGLFGVGLGHGQQKLLRLAEAHTDFIAASVAEELGFTGFALMSLSIGWVVWRGLRAALRAPDALGTYLGLGLSLFIGMHAITNALVCVGSVPTKGLPLAWVSLGGSSCVVSCAAVGVLLNISRPRAAILA